MFKDFLRPHIQTLLLVILLLASVLVAQTTQHKTMIGEITKSKRDEVKHLAESIKEGIMEILMLTPEAGLNIDGYIESLTRKSIKARMIHSPSVNIEYEYEEDEQPQTRAEKDVFADGKPRIEETEDFFIYTTPLEAEEKCQKCHHLPPDLIEPVPAGYVIGLLQISIPITQYKQTVEEFHNHDILTGIIIISLFIFIGYAIYGNIKKIHEREEELKKNNSELEKARSTLFRQEKLASVGTLSAGVAHEILNPLNIMGTIVQVTRMEELPEEMKKNLDEIMNQIKRATKITNNLRMFARQKEADITPVDVGELFDKTALLIEHDLALDNILLEKDYDKNLPIIEADEDLLAQVFLNLLTNAKDAMKGRANNLITVKTEAGANNIVIYFSDNGPGITREIINKIFDPFFTTKDPDKGTGLGLSVIHSIIESHGGTIEVKSEEGQGATFVIRLPVKQNLA